MLSLELMSMNLFSRTQVRVRPGGATSRAFARVVDEWSLDEGWRVLAVDGSPVDSENGLAHASVARRMQRADGDVILRLRRDPKGCDMPCPWRVFLSIRGSSILARL